MQPNILSGSPVMPFVALKHEDNERHGHDNKCRC